MNKINATKISKIIHRTLGNRICFSEYRPQYQYEYIIKEGDFSLLLHYDDDSYKANSSFQHLNKSDIQENYNYSGENKVWVARVQLCFREIKIFDDHFKVSLYNHPETWVEVPYDGIIELTIL